MLTKLEKAPKMKLTKQKALFTAIGIAFIAMSLILLGIIFFPIIKNEINYQIHKNEYKKNITNAPENTDKEEKNIFPIDENFSIVIPAININSRVIADVDTQNRSEYQRKLAEGVAHTKGSAYPGEVGDIFLFAHSGANLEEALRFNAVFYLLNKLEIDDDIFIYYKNKKYLYRVSEKKFANPEELSYNNPSEDPRLILMTCWPPGTTLKRLVVSAKEHEN